MYQDAELHRHCYRVFRVWQRLAYANDHHEVKWRVSSCVDFWITQGRYKMDAVTGVFRSKETAEHAVKDLQSAGIHSDKITLLTPGKNVQEEMGSIPVESTEQPGMGKAVGALIGGAAGLSGGLVLAVIPGVGLVSAIGMLGAAILTAAGASIGAVAGEKAENSMTHGLPEDEIFVYEDALRKGRSVVIVLAEDESAADRVRKMLQEDGAEAIDAAREQWWIGLRGAENEHYSKSGREFRDDEKFYRLGFEAALHARSRCKEFDQVASEMATDVEELKKQYPDAEVEEPYTRGYERGRDYYQGLCNQSKAA